MAVNHGANRWLEAFHQTMTDTTYNFNQFATYYELTLDTVDPSDPVLATNSLDAGTAAFSRAVDYMNAWEAETGFDVSEDL